MPDTTAEAFKRLTGIMNELREKCPWDKKQTIESLRQLTIEETYELTDAITDKNWSGIKEELGDILLHVIFYAKIAAEQNRFTLDDVMNGVCEKLIFRHPHIYPPEGSDIVTVADEEEVKRNWEKLKMKEGKRSLLSGVPRSLPAMVKAMRLQEKVKQVGFEWTEKEQVWEKVEEEKNELTEAIASGDMNHAEEELGDLIFTLVNFARFLHIDAENALERTNKKFIDRFNKMETAALNNGKALQEMTLEEMDAIWNAVKQQQGNQPKQNKSD